MKLSDKARQMLFILGRFLEESDRRFKDTPLGIFVSKADFIDALISHGIVPKKERAIYKNLERLEKAKWIKYDQKVLSLTETGYGNYLKIRQDVSFYMDIMGRLSSEDLHKSERNAQTILRM